MYSKSLFIFRRDFRLDDNTGLINACKQSRSVIPIFIFDRKILKLHKKSNLRKKFLNECVFDLDLQLKRKQSKLHTFDGNVEEIIKKIICKQQVDAVFVNGDFTKFSSIRDQKIDKICKNNGVVFNKFHDSLLHFPEQIKNSTGNPYVVFTHFLKKALQLQIRKPILNKHSNYSNLEFKFEIKIPEIVVSNDNQGGRANAKKILCNLEKISDYKIKQNFPGLGITTRLSPHIRFGTYSIREIHQAISQTLGSDHQLIVQLYWRDFFTQIMHNFPFVRNTEFKEKCRKLCWENNSKKLELWKKGMTGFPIVDAGMRELNSTGIMHNRVRMIVASFLIKDLHLDWRLGEKYFSEKLIDYDPAVNNGNWQWAASTGCDAVPYFRIFNPWIQQKKYDPDCIYIKKWIIELKDATPKEIHCLENGENEKFRYPKPMLSHEIESKKSIKFFQ